MKKRNLTGIPKNLIISHKLTEIPKEFKKMKLEFLIITLFSTGMNLFSFFPELGKNQILLVENGAEKWHLFLGLALIAMYFLRGALSDTFRLWIDSIEINNDEAITTKVNKVVAKLLVKVDGKVFKANSDTKILEAMNNNVILESSVGYISTLWRYQIYFASRVFEIFVLLVMFLGFGWMSLSAFLIITIIILSFIVLRIARKRIKFYNSTRKQTKEKNQEKSIWKNDLLNVKPVNENHATLMISRVEKSFEGIFSLIKFKNKKGNLFNLEKSIFFIIAILLITIEECISATKINSKFVLDLIALLTVFSTIINSITNVVFRFEKMSNSLKDIETYQKDMELILEEYDKNISNPKKGFPAKIKKITIPKQAKISYPQKGKEIPYTLKINQEMNFYPGDVVFVTGPTGCGKSTLLKAITNRIKFDDFSLIYNIIQDGDIETILYETGAKMGAGTMLSELFFTEEEFDKNKMLFLFKNLHITDFLLHRCSENEFWEFLKTAKFSDFSNGEQQRLLFARMLYHLTEDTKIIAFDESTSGLNDEICIDVLRFIKNYCKDKVLFISSHQKALTEQVCNKSITYSEAETYYEAKLSSL